MPMIDVYAPADLFPADADAALGAALTHAVLTAEGVVAPGPFHLDNTAAFIHRLPPTAISTARTPAARAVRVQVITPPASLDREGQRTLTREITDIVTTISGDPTQAARTWVILAEAAEGGWGLAGMALGVEEVTALAARAAAARDAASAEARRRPPRARVPPGSTAQVRPTSRRTPSATASGRSRTTMCVVPGTTDSVAPSIARAMDSVCPRATRSCSPAMTSVGAVTRPSDAAGTSGSAPHSADSLPITTSAWPAPSGESRAYSASRAACASSGRVTCG